MHFHCALRILGAALLISAVSSVLMRPLLPGIIAAYEFEGNFDDSVGGPQLVPAAAEAMTFQPGPFGGQVAVFSDTYLTSSRTLATLPSGSSPRSIACLMRMRSVSAPGSSNWYADGSLALWGQSVPSRGSELVLSSSGGLAFWSYTACTGCDGRALYGPEDAVGVFWSHAVATYDGSVMTLYVNGSAVASGARTMDTTSVASWLYVGRKIFTIDASYAFDSHFSGAIDDLVIFDRALSAREVAALAATGTAASIHTTASPSLSATPTPTATRTQPFCRAPVSRVAAQSGASGAFLVSSSAYAGNAGMYTSGSCSQGYGSFSPGPRLVYRIALSDALPIGGVLTISTCGLTNNNTVLYLGTGCPTWFGSFNCVKGNDDAAGVATCASNPLASTLSHVTSSRIYFVQLGTYSGADVVSGLSWSYSGGASPTKTRTKSAPPSRTRSTAASKSRTRKVKRGML